MNTIISKIVYAKQYVMLLIFALAFGIPQVAYSNANLVGNACKYTHNGNTYAKYTFDVSSYGSISSMLNPSGHYLITSVRVYNANPAVFPAATYTTVPGSVFGPSIIADVTGLSSPYYIAVEIKHYNASSTLVNTYVTTTELASSDCQLDPPDDQNTRSGCFTESNEIELHLDPYILMYANMKGYNTTAHPPTLTICPSGVLSVLGTLTNPAFAANNRLIYNASSLTLDPEKCYDGYLLFYNAEGVVMFEIQVEICLCPKPCTAAFGISTDDLGDNKFGVALTPLTTTGYVTDVWTVTQSSSSTVPIVVYSGPLASLVLPYGNYTICREVTQESGKTCSWCADVCYGAPVLTGPENPESPCPSAFSVETYDYESGSNMFSLGINPVSNGGMPITNDLITITQGGTTVYTGSLASILLPYGTYTICRTITTEGGAVCTWCVEVCFTGGGSHKPGNATSQNQPGISATVVPEKEQLQIRFMAEQPGRISYAVYNNMGQVVLAKQGIETQKGSNRFTETGLNLRTGIYYLKITGSKINTTYKFFVD